MRYRILNGALITLVLILGIRLLPRGDPTLKELVPGHDIEGPVVVLTFQSDCGWCDAAAPHWKEWLARSDLPVFAITPEPLAEGVAYAEGHGWDVEVLSVDSSVPWQTPFAYVFDAAGEPVYSRDGHDLTEIATHFGDRS